MSYDPSVETIDVLKQAGFSPELLKSEIKIFAAVQNQYPELIKATDKEFYAHLQTKHARLAISIEKNLNTGSAWRPGKKEKEILEGEGYWQEIIVDLLGEFLFQLQPDTLVVSKFGYFRSFLRRRYPLTKLNRDTWIPDQLLKRLISQVIGIPVKVQECILLEFKKSSMRKSVPSHLLPRYYFNYVKHNKTKIESIYLKADSSA